MLKNIEVLKHSSIKFNRKVVIYFDPYKIDKNYNDADVVFITHSHYDHYSEEDIKKVIKNNTIIVAPFEIGKESEFKKRNMLIVKPNKSYNVRGLDFKTIPAYNINKNFHPKYNNWIGYVINVDNTTYYIAGDTDATPDNKTIKCDVAFVPIGGTYTMDCKEAADFVNEIKPKVAVPIHYGLISGSKEDGEIFAKLLNKNIDCKIFIK